MGPQYGLQRGRGVLGRHASDVFGAGRQYRTDVVTPAAVKLSSMLSRVAAGSFRPGALRLSTSCSGRPGLTLRSRMELGKHLLRWLVFAALIRRVMSLSRLRLLLKKVCSFSKPAMSLSVRELRVRMAASIASNTPIRGIAGPRWTVCAHGAPTKSESSAKQTQTLTATLLQPCTSRHEQKLRAKLSKCVTLRTQKPTNAKAMQMQKAANAKASKCVSWNTLEYECYNCNGPESRSRETLVFCCRGERAS